MPFYTPPKSQSFDMDSEPNYIVPVIASFNSKGGVQPLYFQYEHQTIKIESVHWCEKKYNVLYYECTAALDGYLTEINLTFYPAESRWIMSKR